MNRSNARRTLLGVWQFLTIPCKFTQVSIPKHSLFCTMMFIDDHTSRMMVPSVPKSTINRSDRWRWWETASIRQSHSLHLWQLCDQEKPTRKPHRTPVCVPFLQHAKTKKMELFDFVATKMMVDYVSNFSDVPSYIITGWWFEPLWKILVNWDDYSQ